MATGVGLRIAEDQCTAAIVTDGDEQPQYIVRDSVLYMSDDGDAELGGEAPGEGAHAITGFANAVGDPAGIRVDDGEAYRAEDLVATALFCLINLTANHLNGAAEFYAAHPAGWPAEHVRSLREALDYLGLRSVLLISEDELSGTIETSVPGASFAHSAATAALAAVLATPAGTTPPDPTAAANPSDVTDVIPTVPDPEPTPQAYSAAMPAARTSLAPESAAPETAIAAPVTQQKPAATKDSDKDRKRIPLLVAAATVIGLALGAIVVALLFRGSDQTPVPPIRDAQSEQAPPPATTQIPVTTEPVQAPPSTETPEAITTTEEPETTTEEPTTTTTTPEPSSSTQQPTTTSSRPTTTRRSPYDQLPSIPTIPGMESPGGYPYPGYPYYPSR